MHTPITPTPPHAAVQPASGSRQVWIIAGGVVGVLVLGLAAWLAMRSMAPHEPRLNEPTPVLAKFVASNDFEHMPFEKQRLYYKMLDDREKEIEPAYKNGQITEGEYRTALDAAWLGKHIGRAEKYAALGPGRARGEYVNQLLTKKVTKKSKGNKKDKADKNEEDTGADEAAAELRVETWPPAAKEQWRAFHDAYRQEKKAREKAATRPANP